MQQGLLESATQGPIKGALLSHDQVEQNMVDLNQDIVLKGEDDTRKDYQFDTEDKTVRNKIP